MGKNPKIESFSNLQLVAPGEMKKLILKYLHDVPTASHVGSNRTFILLATYETRCTHMVFQMCLSCTEEERNWNFKGSSASSTGW